MEIAALTWTCEKGEIVSFIEDHVNTSPASPDETQLHKTPYYKSDTFREAILAEYRGFPFTMLRVTQI